MAKLGNKDAKGRLFFQTRLQNGPTLPEGLPVGKADNQILGVVRNLEAELPGRAIVLVSKDINMRIKARALGLPAEDYFNDHVLEDSGLAVLGHRAIAGRLLEQERQGHGVLAGEARTAISSTFYRVTGPTIPTLLVNQFVYMEPKNGESPFYGQVKQLNGKTAVIQHPARF